MKLIGTAVGSDPGRGVAIIVDQSTRAQGAYRAGDSVGELLLKKIHYRYVIIETGSGDSSIPMGSIGKADSLASSEAVWLDWEEVDDAYPDYEHLMREIRVRPRFEAGRPVGFVIYNIAPGGILERMGIEDGDVITAMNGKPFESSQPVAEFYDAAGEITEFRIPSPDSQPRAIALGADGNIWFGMFAAGKIGRITPAGEITEFAIPTPFSGPRALAAGPDGNIWFSEFHASKIGRITMTGVVTD